MYVLMNYDKYANEQRSASQLLDNNTARQYAALSLTRPRSNTTLFVGREVHAFLIASFLLATDLGRLVAPKG